MKKILILFICFLSSGIVFAQSKSEAERLWELGDKAYKEKRYNEAISYYEKSLKLCGNNQECYASNYNGLAASYEDLGNDNKALLYYEKAIEAARKLGNKEWLADDFFLAGSIYYRRSINYEKAFNYLEESRRLFTELKNKDSLSIVLHELGKVARATGRHDKALSYLNESAKLYKEKGNENSVGANLSQIGLTYSHMGQPDKALSYFEEALKIAKKHNDHEGISIVLRQIGDTYCDLYKHDKAISFYEEAITIQKKLGLKRELGVTLNNLGTMYMDLAQYEKALYNYQESLKIAEQVQDNPTVASLLNNIGHLYGTLGHFNKAFDYYKKSLELERQLKRPYSLTYVLNNMGMEFLKIEKYDDALKYFYEALEIDKKLNNPHLIEIRLNNIGAVYLKQGKLKEAERVFLERKKLEDIVKPNRLLHPGLIEVYILTGRYDQALKLANEIPPTWRDNPKRHIEYNTQIGLALKGKKALHESALHLLNAIKLIEEMRMSVAERSQFFSGGGYYSRLTPYRAMIDVLAEMDEKGHSLTSNNGRFPLKSKEMSQDVHNKRRNSLDILRFGKNPASIAFYFAELTKARTLLEAMTVSKRRIEHEEIPQHLRDTEQNLLNELSYINNKWEETLKKGELAINKLQARREDVKKQLDELISVFRKNYPRYAALNYPLPVKAEDLPIKENEVLLEYAITDEVTYLFIVRKGGIERIIKIPVSKVNLEEIVKSFIEPMNLKKIEGFSIKEARKLYDMLLMEALKVIKENEKLIIVPDGILGLLPFEALVIKEGRDIKDSVYLADKYTISYYQSATILALNRILKQPAPERPLFAVGNPVYTHNDPRYISWKQEKKEIYLTNLNQYSFRGLAIKEKWGAVTDDEKKGKIEFQPLPETEEEIREIAKIIGVAVEPPHILLSVMANEKNVKKAGLEKYKFIHFATHASLPGMIQGINEPFILLSQVENQGDDGFLTLSEVANLKLNAEMVVLSACVTGIGREVEGEGVVNFARAFQQSGSKSVIVSLWEVASEPAVEYMKMFYTHLKSGKNISEAMRLTRIQIKAKYPNPFYWAVFIHHGEG